MSNITSLSATRLPINEIDLCVWLGQAAPGDVLEYHRGALAHDREARISRLPERDRGELIRVGKRAFWAAEKGLAHLVQRRNGPDDYSYLAIARPRPRRTSVSLSELMLAEVA